MLLIAAAVLFAALTLGSVGWYLQREVPVSGEVDVPGDVRVPNLRGKTPGEAARMVGSDLEIDQRETAVRSTGQPLNTIVSQDPAPDERVDKGSEIEVGISGR